MKLRELFFPYDNRAEHNKALDGLRGWAVLLVLFGHATNQGLSPWLDGYFLSRGKLGVYLFFIISAYLLDKQIIQVWQQGRGNASYWRYYISRRIMRIFPPFLLALITFRLMNEAGYKVVIREWSHVWEHLALMRGDHIFWSIPTEFRYYLISPLLLLLCLRLFELKANHTVRFFAAIIIATFIINYYNELPRFSTLRYLGIFAIGTLIAAFETLYQAKFQWFIQSKWLTNLFILALGIFLGWGSASDDFTHSNVYIPSAILWGILLMASLQEGVWRSFLSFRPFRFIGTISYSLYLFHIPVLMWIKSLGLSNAIAFPAFLSLSIAVAALLHVLVERPALSLVKK
jgi:peptidoglycan/LPS O-acetylase OafA/YrhL